MRLLIYTLIIGFSLGVSSKANADIRFNGFASVKAGTTLGSGETLYKYEDELSWRHETLVGLQFGADLQQDLSVTAQLVGRGSESYETNLEWAYISYRITDNLKFNAGRIRTPFYKYTDFIDVGYAYDWVRVPQSVYNLNFTNLDGVSLYYTSQLMGFDSTLHLTAGSNDGRPEIAGRKVDGKVRGGYGIIWELNRDFFTVRLAHLGGELTASDPELNGFTEMLRGIGYASLADDLLLDDSHSDFNGLAVTLDKYDWVLVSELTNVTFENSFVPEQTGFYVSLGHRMESFTPYISYEKRDDSAKREIYADVPQTAPFYSDLAGLIDSLAVDREAWSLGMRYDFHSSAAFKVQLTHSDNKITNEQNQLLTFGIDLVF
ncbi:hypothetical protein SAMN06297229_0225 [Pseudidiomarina planktonica]|uniref:Porin n=1 Tax=Pseudidiomarina planktonica TaxID=1323738 RepID=A0A1Y6EG83_9GAMM|nr:putative porin [Pseudidiomarina planktonica]RUO66278.1 hypothetical protein CWI77_07610 [Pseudidiomarina planktonica]SMQ59163.1 hypothetical protein SAMN06297229_0225 [Pseudidiomarina planktonica]